MKTTLKLCELYLVDQKFIIHFYLIHCFILTEKKIVIVMTLTILRSLVIVLKSLVNPVHFLKILIMKFQLLDQLQEDECKLDNTSLIHMISLISELIK